MWENICNYLYLNILWFFDKQLSASQNNTSCHSDHFQYLRFHGFQIWLGRIRLNHDNNILPRCNFLFIEAENFADDPLNSISGNKMHAYPITNTYSQPAMCQSIGCSVYPEPRRFSGGPCRVNMFILGWREQPFKPAEALRAHGYGVNTARPLRRRRFNIARPSFVAMRLRNPCFLLRLRFDLGRKFFFISPHTPLVM